MAQRDHSNNNNKIIVIKYYDYLMVCWWSNSFIYRYFDQGELTDKVEIKGKFKFKKKQNNGHAISELLIPNNGNTTPIQGQYCKFRKINVKILGEREGVIPRAERLYNGLRLKGNVSHSRGKNKWKEDDVITVTTVWKSGAIAEKKKIILATGKAFQWALTSKARNIKEKEKNTSSFVEL